MKETITAVLAALALAALPLAAPAAAAELKIGVVDLQKALNTTREGTQAKETLSLKVQVKKDQLAPREKELKDIQEKLKSPVLAKEAKAALQKDFEKKAAEFQELASRAQLEIKRETQAAEQKIMDGLIDISRQIAKDEGYNLMVEKNEGGLIYHADALDLTDRVVKAYDEKNPGAGEKKP